MFGLFLLLDSQLIKAGISRDGACWAGPGTTSECAKEYKGNKNKMEGEGNFFLEACQWGKSKEYYVEPENNSSKSQLMQNKCLRKFNQQTKVL